MVSTATPAATGAYADLASAYALAERQRLAREIHDILAHSLSAQARPRAGRHYAFRHGPASTED